MNIKEISHFLHWLLTANFSVKKLKNFLQTANILLITRLTGKNIPFNSYPLEIMIEPTNICNLSCPLCDCGSEKLTRSKGIMTLDLFKKIIDEIGDYIFHLMLWNQGEPFINKNLNSMILYAKQKGIYVETSTNGHFLTDAESITQLVESGLDRIWISLDGASDETYQLYRKNGNFNKVKDGIKNLVNEKKRQKKSTPFIYLQFIIMKHNEHEIEKMKSLAKELKVDNFSLKTVQVRTIDEANKYLPTNEKYRRYNLEQDKFIVKSSLSNYCKRLWYSLVVNWDGTISPCCFDKDAKYKLGNISNGISLKNIWTGEKYFNFRNLILHNRKYIAMCCNCSEGLEIYRKN